MVVPIDTPPPQYSDKAIRMMEAEHQLEKDEKFTGWAVIWTLFAFKLGTVAVILIIASQRASSDPSGKTMAYVAATTWYWFFIPVVAFSGFVAWRLRLRAARKRAALYRAAEFAEAAPAVSEHHELTDAEKHSLSRLMHRREVRDDDR